MCNKTASVRDDLKFLIKENNLDFFIHNKQHNKYKMNIPTNQRYIYTN